MQAQQAAATAQQEAKYRLHRAQRTHDVMVQAQQALATAQQEAKYRLHRAQRTLDVMVSIARSRAFLHPYIAHGPHSIYSLIRWAASRRKSKRIAASAGSKQPSCPRRVG